MGSPQDPRARRKKRIRRDKKNAAWMNTRAEENNQVAGPKTPPKKAT